MTNKKEMTKGKKLMLSVMTCCMLISTSGFYSMAANYGEKAGNWILKQLFWVGAVALAAGLVGCILKKAWVAAIILVLAGGCILFFLNSPELIKTIGETIVNTVLNN